MKRKIVAGNWKSNTNLGEAKALVEGLTEQLKEYDGGRVIIAPPAPYLGTLKPLCGPNIALAAQNCSAYDTGAFTGEYTAGMLDSVGVQYVLAGHSERRQLFGEDNATVARKVRNILDAGLFAILCVGESLDERESGRHFDVVKEQLDVALFKPVDAEEARHVIVAYEPVWAIGTGKTASAEQAQEMHAAIRNWMKDRYGNVAEDLSILYGGSVKPANAGELFNQQDVDGGLIGGASLKVDDFVSIIEANKTWTTAS